MNLSQDTCTEHGVGASLLEPLLVQVQSREAGKVVLPETVEVWTADCHRLDVWGDALDETWKDGGLCCECGFLEEVGAGTGDEGLADCATRFQCGHVEG